MKSESNSSADGATSLGLEFRPIFFVKLAVLLLLVSLASGCSESKEELSLDEVRALQAQGRFAPTVEPLRARIDAGQRDSETLLLYGVALTKEQMFSQALWPLREAAKDPEKFVPAMMELASGAYMTSNHDLAIERLSEVIELEPENTHALMMRGMSRLHSRRDYAGALEDIELVLELEPEKSHLKASRIVALLGLKNIDEAREAIEEFADEGILGEDEESETPIQIRALACVGRAKFAKEDGDKEAATRYYEECAEAFPSQPLAVYEAMEYFRDIDDLEKFDATLKAAYAAAPQDREFRIALARRQQLLGNNDEARQILEEGAEAGYPGASIDLAGYLADAGDLNGALEQYRAARKLGAASGSFILSFGEALIEAKEYDEALSLADDPGPESHRIFIRGRVALKKGEPEKALELFTQGVLMWPDNAVARYYTAVAAEQLGLIDRAIEEYRNALRIDADAADARIRLARLHLAERDPHSALYILRYQTHKLESLRKTLAAILLELEGIGWVGSTEKIAPELLSRVSYPGIWGQAVASLARGARERAGADAGIDAIKAADRLDLTAATSASALRLLVELEAEKGEHQKAIAVAKRAADANPDKPAIQAILADALIRGGKTAEAAALMDKTLEANPESPAALIVRGNAALALGDAKSAHSFFDRVPDDMRSVEAYRAEASALVSLGRVDDARARLQSALEADPYDGATVLALAQLEIDQGASVSDERVQTLLQAAARFRGGEGALQLLGESKPEKAVQQAVKQIEDAVR